MATLSDITGSAVVQTRMVFSSSSPVPSESLVLNVTQTLLSARLTNLTDSVKVLNFTYERISDTSYAVKFTFNISNVNMTQNPDLRNDTYSQVDIIINNAGSYSQCFHSNYVSACYFQFPDYSSYSNSPFSP
ncbi:hypothetical protein KOW79_002028 [Hemibagrus wyckioides]|uniref:Uncharacterized protein n=1 Tax=Hemibagrus wyckioides TaxID=337641 RepID=A0A9D3SQL1_9TELE|nr:hypothetical protein KOW79_002028 [Hemibagrus wyckioides]